MKRLIKITTAIGSGVFKAYESDEGSNFILLEKDAYAAVERFAEDSGISYPSLVSECILCAINEGGVTSDSWEIEEEGDLGGFSFELFQFEDSYDAYQDYTDSGKEVWFVDYVDSEKGVIWTESHDTLEEVKTVYAEQASFGLLHIVEQSL